MRGWNATVATAVTGDALLRLRAKMGTRRAEATAGEAAAAAAAAAGLGDAAAAAAAVAQAAGPGGAAEAARVAEVLATAVHGFARRRP